MLLQNAGVLTLTNNSCFFYFMIPPPSETIFLSLPRQSSRMKFCPSQEQNDPYPLVKFALYLKNLCDQAFAFTFTFNALGESLFQLIHGLIDSVIHQ